MGSLVEGEQALRDGIKPTTAAQGVAPKPEPNNIEGSCSSAVSTPEPDGEVVVRPDPVQRQKRKGGRKPIYATSEERKQRNRQAQAAFRERRTEYIKQLEATIKLNEETLRTLQQSHRSAADECLMLRYKNSLLERVLMEKGIDVQAELRLKSGSPSIPPARLPQHQPHRSSPLSQPTHSRQQSHQSVGMMQRTTQGGLPQAHREGTYNASSQIQQSTPSSHVSHSPAASASPGYSIQNGAEIHASSQLQQQKSQYQRPPLPQPGNFGQGTHALTPVSVDAPDSNAASRAQSSYFISSFPKHYDQLDQEYDAQTMGHNPQESEGHTTSSNTYPTEYSNSRGVHRSSLPDLHAHVGENDGIGSVASFVDHFDPMLDADPFGLSASMHFQTPFSYAQSNVR